MLSAILAGIAKAAGGAAKAGAAAVKAAGGAVAKAGTAVGQGIAKVAPEVGANITEGAKIAGQGIAQGAETAFQPMIQAAGRTTPALGGFTPGINPSGTMQPGGFTGMPTGTQPNWTGGMSLDLGGGRMVPGATPGFAGGDPGINPALGSKWNTRDYLQKLFSMGGGGGGNSGPGAAPQSNAGGFAQGNPLEMLSGMMDGGGMGGGGMQMPKARLVGDEPTQDAPPVEWGQVQPFSPYARPAGPLAMSSYTRRRGALGGGY